LQASSKESWQNYVGYPDKLKWQVYDIHADSFKNPDVEGIPREEGLASGLGYKFSPFYEANGTERSCCHFLGQWWDCVESQLPQKAEHRVQCTGKTVREHKLLSEPSIGDYFNCTIEVRLSV
jgi:hypothetical protein